ncbi:MAG: molybdenum cofactor cytidylyltransferase [Cyclobacteriaceae bacterium]
MKSGDLAILILAAGSSSRLGQPKQLLPYKKTTLLEHTITCAKSVSDNVFVILGGNQSAIQSTIDLQDIEVILTQDWYKGIGSSISSGVKSITKTIQDTESIMILLCDQPKITNELLVELVDLHEKKEKSISACKYGDSFGVPAIFNRCRYDDLEKLKDDSGAKNIICKNKNQTSFLNFPEGNIDIDNPDDLKHI